MTIGINLSGAEFGTGNVYGRDYIYPGQSDLKFYADRGITLVRLPVKWERLEPVVGGPLDAGEVGRLKTFLADAAATGSQVIIDLHNYGRFGGQVLGSAGAPIADFASFWSKLAQAIGGSPALAGYDLMNEPHKLGNADIWPAAAQAAIDAIRGVDMTTAIYVAGDNWSSAGSFFRTNKTLGGLTDPADNLVYEAHIYFDRYGAGTYTETYDAQGANPLLGVQRLQSFQKFLEANNARGFIGEVAVPKGDPRWLTVLDNFLGAAEAYGIDTAYWGGGPWFGNYALGPRGKSGAPNPQLAVLERYANSAVDLTLTGGDGNDALAGGRGKDVIGGGGGDDALRGRGGADVIDGGTGTDSVSYRSSPRAVSIDLQRSVQRGGDAEGDRLTSIETVHGSGFADVLRGDAGPNALYGHAGNDLLEGRGGGDLLDGGWGNDTVVYASAVTIDLKLTVQANGDRLVAIENVTGSDGADRLRGDDRNNVLTGSGGDDVLEGRGGTDTLDGGTGNDTASFASASAGVTASLITGKANGAATGSDTLIGIENLAGSGFDDVLRGDGGVNIIDGGAGNDRLIGMGGADRLTGGAGADVFVYTVVADSLAANPDHVLDFTPGIDRIDLTGVDAMAARSGNQPFSWIANAAFTAPGQLRIDTSVAGQVTVFGNVDANLLPDFAIVLHTMLPVTVTDFVL